MALTEFAISGCAIALGVIVAFAVGVAFGTITARPIDYRKRLPAPALKHPLDLDALVEEFRKLEHEIEGGQ